MREDRPNCWEIMKCHTEKTCPAYPDDGRICYSVSGTYCGGTKQLGFVEKRENCAKCQCKALFDKG